MLQRTLRLFAKDMDSVSASALQFFAKYMQGGSNIEFAKDFRLLVAALTTRVRKEESSLYQEYEKLQ